MLRHKNIKIVPVIQPRMGWSPCNPDFPQIRTLESVFFFNFPEPLTQRKKVERMSQMEIRDYVVAKSQVMNQFPVANKHK